MRPSSYNVSVPLFVWREDRQYVATSPALELSSCGDTQETAIQNFAEAVSLFVETASERNALPDLLESLGWKFIRNRWAPNTKPVEKSLSFEVTIPVSNNAAC